MLIKVAVIRNLYNYIYIPLILQVERYMESLPKECVPALGTEGERYRRTQCFQQLPIYDFSLEACHKMSEREAKRHAKITTRRRDEGFGVGIVKLLSSEQKKVQFARFFRVLVCVPRNSIYCFQTIIGFL